MTSMIQLARQGRANALARIGGASAGTSTGRSRSVGYSEVVTFSSVRGRR
ncbi:MAG: hypothetical protein WAT77_03070 [Paracoccaceae bacterium]|jgi:hypothetical protein